jgi:ABC-2 type transport system permease protein
MGKIWALAGKDLRLLLRDKGGFFFVFFFPLLIAIFFGIIFSGGGGERSALPIAVVDEDHTDPSRAFVKKLSAVKEIAVLDTDRVAATALVQKGKRIAAVILKPGFGQASGHMFWGEGAQIEIGADPARQAETSMLQGILIRYYMEGLQANFTDPRKMQGNLRESISAIQSAPDSQKQYFAPLAQSLQLMDKFFAQPQQTDSAGKGEFSGWEPLKVTVSEITIQHEGPKNAFEVTFPQAIIWALVGCSATFGVSLISERTRGTLLRLRISALSRADILAGKALACFLTTTSVMTLLYLIAALVFGVHAHSLLLLIMAGVSAGLCFVGVMMLLSVLGKTEASASGIGWAVMLVMTMIGGGMLPLFLMPTWMRTLSNLSPIKWSILALEGAIWRGFDLNAMLPPCGILLGIGIVCFLVGTKVFQWNAE